MTGNGWKSDYGISEEGIDMLGYIEALPREARRELVATVELLCRSQGYLTLHDQVGPPAVEPAAPPAEPGLAKVIPLRPRR